MDTWERLKIGAALAGTALVLLVIHGITDLVFPETYAASPGYKVPGVSELAVDLGSLQRSWPAGLNQQGGRASVRDFMSNIKNVSVPRSPEVTAVLAAPAPVDLGTRLAAADAAKGRQTAQVCTSCHTLEQGGPDRTGPNLWGVVGRNVASRKTFTYSSAVAAQTGSWTYERLDRWLTNPAKAVPGTKMSFAGLHQPEDRANVLAFLRTLSASPVPFPKAERATIITSPLRSGARAAPGGEHRLASRTTSDAKTKEPQNK